MLRKSTDEDISDEELETIINPFNILYNNSYCLHLLQNNT